MSFLQAVLRKLLYGSRDLCCICLRNIENDLDDARRTDFDDEVVLLENNSQKNLKISEIFSYVFGNEIFLNISAFEDICIQCITTTVNTYKFIKDVKDNIQYLSNVVEYMKNSLEQTAEYTDGNNTLFLALKSDLSLSSHYYANINSQTNITEVLEKFNLNQTAQSVPKKTNKKRIKPKQEKQYPVNENENQISMDEMLYDKGDLQNIRCKYCFKQFETVSSLKSHFMRIHAPKTFQCIQCPKKFSMLKLLNAHKASNHCDNLMCADCGKVFTNSYTLKEHEKTHYLQIICPDCGRVYKNRNTFKNHKDNNVCNRIGRHSPADAKFTCDYCQKKYTQKMSLRVHIQYEHGNYKYHECEWCYKKFWCQARLKAHIVKHTKEKKFSCSICEGLFVSKESLLYHTRIHTGERPYACHLCDSKFLSASRRSEHVKSQHTNPIACNICNSVFKSVHYLMKHKKMHSENKTKKEIIKVDGEKQDNTVKDLQESIQIDINSIDVNPNLEPVSQENVVYNMDESYVNVEYHDGNEITPVHKNVKYYLLKESKDEQVFIEVSENVEVKN